MGGGGSGLGRLWGKGIRKLAGGAPILSRSPHELFHFLKENFDRKISVSLPWI